MRVGGLTVESAVIDASVDGGAFGLGDNACHAQGYQLGGEICYVDGAPDVLNVVNTDGVGNHTCCVVVLCRTAGCDGASDSEAVYVFCATMVADERSASHGSVSCNVETGNTKTLAVKFAFVLIDVVAHRSPGAILKVDVSGELSVVVGACGAIDLSCKPEELTAVVDEIVTLAILRSLLIGSGAGSVGAETIYECMGMAGRLRIGIAGIRSSCTLCPVVAQGSGDGAIGELGIVYCGI